MVFFSIMPETMIAAMPMKYAEVETQGLPPNRAPAIIPINGTFAPQGIKVVVIMVILRSRSFSMVLEAMIPGTPHPTPMSMGIKLLPESPNLRNTRSRTNAIRAI